MFLDESALFGIEGLTWKRFAWNSGVYTIRVCMRWKQYGETTSRMID